MSSTNLPGGYNKASWFASCLRAARFALLASVLGVMLPTVRRRSAHNVLLFASASCTLRSTGSGRKICARGRLAVRKPTLVTAEWLKLIRGIGRPRWPTTMAGGIKMRVVVGEGSRWLSLGLPNHMVLVFPTSLNVGRPRVRSPDRAMHVPGSGVCFLTVAVT
jgi:hypothetical protein